MAHGSVKPTGRPIILHDRDERSVKGIVFFFNRRNRKKTHIFQKDNAAIHKSSSTLLVFHEEDQNIVWGLLAQAAYCHGKQFQTVAELNYADTEEWDKIQPSYLESLTNSRNNRLFQVMQKFGGPNSY
uniref:Uncharacterized protein n=1 Tax=Caenorhabditis japonica TaxID=281687 RepID=A0A8R1HVR0_CAEJA